MELLSVLVPLLLISSINGFRVDYKKDTGKANQTITEQTDVMKIDEGFRNLSHAEKQTRAGSICAALAIDAFKYFVSTINFKRACAININNKSSKDLVNPHWYLSWGSVGTLPSHQIDSKSSDLMSFTKTGYSWAGTTGVLTYDIKGSSYKLVVMWSIPLSYAYYSNVFNVKILSYVEANADLYSKMTEDQTYADKCTHYVKGTGGGLTVYGAMTNDYKASLSVVVENYVPPSQIIGR